MSDDLVSFLRARLDEDEQVAQAPPSNGPWRAEGNSVWDSDDQVARTTGSDDAAHIACHDPSRVLAEVAAKRAILARLDDTAPPYADSRQQEIHETLRDEVVPHLAAVYAAHPEYRSEWAL